jgi:hypothetical protein
VGIISGTTPAIIHLPVRMIVVRWFLAGSKSAQFGQSIIAVDIKTG